MSDCNARVKFISDLFLGMQMPFLNEQDQSISAYIMEFTVVLKFLFFGCVLHVVQVVADETCTVDNGTRTTQCSHGCCGSFPNETCCKIAPWVIALSVIGGLILIGASVGFICCCFMSKNFRMKIRAQTLSSLRQNTNTELSSGPVAYRTGPTTRYGNKTQPLFFGGGKVKRRIKDLPPLRSPAPNRNRHKHNHHYDHQKSPVQMNHIDLNHLHPCHQQRRGSLLLQLQEQQQQQRRGSFQQVDSLKDQL